MGKNNPDTSGPQGYPPDPSASTQTAYDPLEFDKYALANCYTGNDIKTLLKFVASKLILKFWNTNFLQKKTQPLIKLKFLIAIFLKQKRWKNRIQYICFVKKTF